MTTGLSYLEYRLYTLLLVGFVAGALLLLEWFMRHYNILPYAFRCFKVERRRIFCFGTDITLHQLGKNVRKEAKMCLRLTLVVAFAYVWEQLVIETSVTTAGTRPEEQCENGMDCFQAPLSFDTLLANADAAIDCSKVQELNLSQSSFVNCLKFRNPNIIELLAQGAITYSLVLLNLRAYELLTWLALRARWVECLYYFVAIVYVIAVVILFLVGALGQFVNSFLAFATMFEFAALLKIAAWSACYIRQLKKLHIFLAQGNSIDNNHHNEETSLPPPMKDNRPGPGSQAEKQPLTAGEGGGGAEGGGKALAACDAFQASPALEAVCKAEVKAAEAKGMKSNAENEGGGRDALLKEMEEGVAGASNGVMKAENGEGTMQPRLPPPQARKTRSRDQLSTPTAAFRPGLTPREETSDPYIPPPRHFGKPANIPYAHSGPLDTTGAAIRASEIASDLDASLEALLATTQQRVTEEAAGTQAPSMVGKVASAIVGGSTRIATRMAEGVGLKRTVTNQSSDEGHGGRAGGRQGTSARERANSADSQAGPVPLSPTAEGNEDVQTEGGQKQKGKGPKKSSFRFGGSQRLSAEKDRESGGEEKSKSGWRSRGKGRDSLKEKEKGKEGDESAAAPSGGNFLSSPGNAPSASSRSPPLKAPPPLAVSGSGAAPSDVLERDEVLPGALEVPFVPAEEGVDALQKS